MIVTIPPLYKIVEEFADDQKAWMNEFVISMEKMLANGYSEIQLRENGVIPLA